MAKEQINVISVDQALRDGIASWKIENCLKHHREAALRADEHGDILSRRRHSRIAVELQSVLTALLIEAA